MRRHGFAAIRPCWASCSTICWKTPASTALPALRSSSGSGAKGEMVALAVQDHGDGLMADDLSHVFEPFFRSAEARGAVNAGVGLGLAIVQRIAAVFGGTITAESVPGQGSRFVLRVPEATESVRASGQREMQGQCRGLAREERSRMNRYPTKPAPPLQLFRISRRARIAAVADLGRSGRGALKITESMLGKAEGEP